MTRQDHNKPFETIPRAAKRNATLRKQAEEQLRNMEPLSQSGQTPEELQRVLHELRVRQIELEMQNEELRTAQAEIEAGRDRYRNLYDLAPVGYCILSEQGVILEANPAAAALVDTAHSELVKQPLSRFIIKDDQDIYNHHRKQLFGTGEAQEFELRLVKADGAVRWAHLKATAARAEDGSPVSLVVVSDIAGRKQAEEALRESEARFHELFERAPLGYQSLDSDGRFIAVNMTWLETLGYKREEVVGRWFGEFLAPEYIQAFRERFPLFKARGEVHTAFNMLHKDGSRRYIAFDGRIGHHADGGFKQTHCILQDVTAQKQAEDALRESEQLLSGSQAIAHIGSWRLDLAANRLTWSDEVYRIFGCRPQEFAATYEAFLGFVHPEDRAAVDEAYSRSQREGHDGYEIEHRIVRRNSGEVRHVHERCVHERDAAGAIVRSTGMVQDITERKQAEESLRQSEANFRQFFESITDIMVVATPEGRILFTNQAARDTLGYSEDELAAMHLLDWHRPEDRDDAEAILAGMLKGEPGHCPLPLTAKDGTVLPVETRAWHGRWNGQDCVFGICKDLSAQQEAQQRFEHIFRRNPSPMALSSIPDRRFVDVNDAFLEATGYTREEIIGKTTTELGLAAAPEAYDAVAEDLRTQGSIANRELQIRRKDGSLRDGLFSGEVIRSQGRECFLTVMIDITERKRAEDSLRESTQHIQSIFRSAPIGIGVVTHRIMKKVNQRLCEMTGYAPEELLDQSARMLYLSQEHFDHVGREKYAQLREHGTGTVETQWKRKDGMVIDVLLSSTPIDMSDLSKGVTFTAMDITERKRAEAQLRLQSLVLNQIQDRVTVTDLDGVITYVNDAEVQALGYPRDELIGASTEKYGEDAEQGATQLQILEETLKHGSWRGTVVNQTVTGEDVILDCRTSVVLDEQGNKVALAGLSTDITERKRAERDLRESELRYRALVMQSADCMILHDLEGKIVDVNATSCRTYGYTREELLTMRCGDLDVDDDQQADRGAFYQTMQPGHATEFEARQRTRDGRIFPVEVRLMLVEIQGKIFIQGLYRDVTERQQHDQRQRLLMRELDHRVKNNLAAVQGLVHVTRINAKSLDGFCDVFLGRLIAMAHAHEALARAKWEGMKLREAVTVAIGAHLNHRDSRISVEGLDIQLPSRSAQPVTLALHELGVNALKHGSLSRTTGHVDVSWAQNKSGHIALCWHESGGPPVTPPEQPGSGLGLIEGLITHEVGGHVDMSFEAEGLTCRLLIPTAAPQPVLR